MEILIIEDDLSIAEIERDFLEMNGFKVTLETDGKKGMELALSGKFSLILLDLMLPGRDGYEICRRIRSKIDIPVLIVSARSDDNDKVRGLGLGADDYIAKPFSPNELLARVKAHIAQYARLKAGPAQEKNDAEIIAGNLRMNYPALKGGVSDFSSKNLSLDRKLSILRGFIPRNLCIGKKFALKLPRRKAGSWVLHPRVPINHKTHQVFVSGKEINLKNKEYELLYFLASNPAILFSKEQCGVRGIVLGHEGLFAEKSNAPRK